MDQWHEIRAQSDSSFVIPTSSFFLCISLSRIPLTNWADWAPPKRLASSTASSIATLTGRFGKVDLVGAQPQQVAVGGGHPLEAPVVGRGGDLLVQLGPVRPHALDRAAA